MSRMSLRLLVGLLLLVPLAAAIPAPAPVQEEEEELTFEEIMEKVNESNITIRRSYRSPITFKRDKDKILEAAKTISKMGKLARKETKYAEAVGEDHAKWTEISDAMIKGSDGVAKIIEDGGSNKDVSAAYRDVLKSCSQCHNVFRKDDDF